MIFDYCYDKALWLLVAGNKKDREKICDFIKYIPDDIYLKIQKAISDYYSGNLENIRENVIYSDEFLGKDGYGSSIVVKIKAAKLYLNLYRWKEDIDRIEEEYSLILSDLSLDYLDEMLIFDKSIVGRYSSEVNNIKFIGCLTDVETSSYDRKYYIEKYPLGYIVFSKFGRKYVNVKKNIPEDLNVTDFSSKDTINALVKKRIRDKNNK